MRMGGVLVLLVVAGACTAHHSAAATPAENVHRRRVDAIWSLTDGKSVAVTADGWKCVVPDTLARQLRTGSMLECAWR